MNYGILVEKCRGHTHHPRVLKVVDSKCLLQMDFSVSKKRDQSSTNFVANEVSPPCHLFVLVNVFKHATKTFKTVCGVSLKPLLTPGKSYKFHVEQPYGLTSSHSFNFFLGSDIVIYFYFV